MPERHDVAQTILDLIELGAPIKRSTILKSMKIGISTKAAKVVDGLVQDLQGSGLLEGDARKGMTVPKGAVAGLRTMLITEEEWVAEAKALIEGLGHHLADHIDLEKELSEQPNWFRRSRLPWLYDERFFLRGINRNGETRDRQPMNGWITGDAPADSSVPK